MSEVFNFLCSGDIEKNKDQGREKRDVLKDTVEGMEPTWGMKACVILRFQAFPSRLDLTHFLPVNYS